MADLKRALRAVGIIQGRKGEVLSFLFFLSDKKKKSSQKLLTNFCLKSHFHGDMPAIREGEDVNFKLLLERGQRSQLSVANPTEHRFCTFCPDPRPGLFLC